jgi:hypothetical protein
VLANITFSPALVVLERLFSCLHLKLISKKIRSVLKGYTSRKKWEKNQAAQEDRQAWQQYPVFYLDLNAGKYKEAADLEYSGVEAEGIRVRGIKSIIKFNCVEIKDKSGFDRFYVR